MLDLEAMEGVFNPVHFLRDMFFVAVLQFYPLRCVNDSLEFVVLSDETNVMTLHLYYF